MAFTGLALARFGLLGEEAEAATYPVSFTPEQWKKRLTEGQFKVLRQEATEAPYSSPLTDEHRAGLFSCQGCQQKLFSSKNKFDSGTGWPSFWKPLPKAVAETKGTFADPRDEVHCTRCGGHLGHVFDDGPKPTGLRYCMNGVALKFTPGPAA